MATGDSNDILKRVLREIPARWFSSVAPVSNAIMGGLADLSSWSYSWITYLRAQSRLATATGLSLDLIAYDFLGLYLRRKTLNDASFKAKIKSTILQERVTRNGMVSALTTLTGNAPVIFEPWNTGDAGAWNIGAIAWAGSAPGTAPGGGWNAASGWDTNASGYDINTTASQSSGGAGGWGSTSLPNQVLIIVSAAAAQGIPNIGGWNAGPAAWNRGIGEMISDDMIDDGSLTDQDIYDTINNTKPTGTVAWTRLS